MSAAREWESMQDVPSDVTVYDRAGDLWFGAEVGYGATTMKTINTDRLPRCFLEPSHHLYEAEV